MGDALERWLSANVEQPFAENARLKHAGAPQGQPERWMSRDQLLEVLVVNDTDRAVRYRCYSDFIVHFRQHMLVKITEVTGILKRIYLPGAVLEPLIQAGDSVNQHRRMSRRPAGGYNVFASTDTRSDLDAIQNGIQFRVAVDAQTSEFLDQRIKGLSPRWVQQTDHVQLPSSPHRTNSAGTSHIACGAPLVANGIRTLSSTAKIIGPDFPKLIVETSISDPGPALLPP
jgi:hypothetical protein